MMKRSCRGGSVPVSEAADVLHFPVGQMTRHDERMLDQWLAGIDHRDEVEVHIDPPADVDDTNGFDLLTVTLGDDPFGRYVIYRPVSYGRWVTVNPECPDEGIVRETRTLWEALDAIRPGLPEPPPGTVIPFPIHRRYG